MSSFVAASVVADPRRVWPLVVARGVFAVLFGILTLVWPGVTVLALAIVFGVYALFDGVSAIVQAFRPGDGAQRAAYALLGVLGVLAGVLALVWPGATVVVLTTLVGAWAVVTGVAEIVAAVRLRRQITGEAFLIVAGVLSVVAGVLVLVHPIAGAFGIAVLIGVYALLYGVMLIVLGLRLRRLAAPVAAERAPEAG
ncbi:HdeD family acid-resistance protein [Amycolatopsis sp. PS_44_ISF1]|uniref:HdeD family acid-resistance protein n=1 Tax=Amycolatopsis sp. PS_44_ISF1 TaxID=2974917 RepID=UPI0028DDADEC|nr:HdeD family acid-resistance protein [Amycolatopsis sp. PS_44_ISF1]MDT8913772.1 HdeD family acid-resistance protein [Amycolatopsis sp. PS_44_ISF1]